MGFWGFPSHTCLEHSLSLQQNDSFNFSFFPTGCEIGSGERAAFSSRILGGRRGGPTTQWQIMRILGERLINHGAALRGGGTRLIPDWASVAAALREASRRRRGIRAAPSPWESRGWSAGGIGRFCQSPPCEAASVLVRLREREADYSKREARRWQRR